MSATSVGEIGLDLVVNSNEFKKDMSGITGMAKKAGAALAGAFAVKKLINFGKECIELGSDLQEVQNVVDVTFPRMTKRVDEFAKSAAGSCGLSETMAKRFTGTFGSMAKAFGFSEAAALEMGTSLTGLAGDVASFYNISQDEAYTKLKSVFTGETESLKDLGVVMTQSALDAYAMANGFGKTTKQMDEAEKVALRYAFVQDRLSAAQGDFARTSGGWANQVRVLKLQFDSLKATIGQGFINLFTPIIKVINTVLGKLTTLANAFKSFSELITGNKSSGGSSIPSELGDMGSGLGDAAGAAGSLEDATKGVGGAAKKAAKEMKALMGFDKINKIDSSSDSGSGSGGGAGGGAGLGNAVDYGNLADGEDVISKTSGKLDGLLKRVKELAGLFKSGFEIGFGDSEKKISSIQGHIAGIKKSLYDVFTDKGVVKAANRMFDSIVMNLGKLTGSAASIGLTIADNLAGGIDKYLQNSGDYIKERLKNVFDISADVLELFGDLCVDIADIFSTFANDDGKRVTSSVIGIFVDACLGIEEIVARSSRNIFMVIAGIIDENKEKIKTSIEKTLSPLAVIGESLQQIVDDTFSKISEVYDKYIDPAFVRIKNGFSTICDTVLDAYNNYLAPVIGWIADRFSWLASQYIQPLVDAFLELAGKAIEALSMLWEFISPFVGWFVEKFIAVFASKLQELWTKFEVVFSVISSILEGFMKILGGIIDVISGVFTGNWEKAWDGIKGIFSGIWTAIGGVISSVWEYIKNTITTAITKVKNTISVVLNGIKTVISSVWTVLKNLTKTVWDNIRDFITNPFRRAKEIIVTILDSIAKKFGTSFDAIANAIKRPINKIIGFINSLIRGMMSGVNAAIRALNRINIKIPEWVPGFGGKNFGLSIPQVSAPNIPYLAKGGYVKQNTPQLAMIGDNRHQGEVVAPEGKMLEMARMAAEMSGGNTEEMLRILKAILELLLKIKPVIIDDESLRKYFIEVTNANTKKNGKPELLY